MAEETPHRDPLAEGKRIANDYLSKLNWAKEWKRTIWREIPMAWQRDEREDKIRSADQGEIDAEAGISSAFEKLRKSEDPSDREVLRGIYHTLKGRFDLGFIGMRILSRLKVMFGNT